MTPSKPPYCEWANCDQPAVVGLGADPMWLCRDHYERELQRRIKALDAASAMFKALVGR